METGGTAVTTQREFGSSGVSQCAVILGVLCANPGRWVPMPKLAQAAGCYAVHSRIADLRKRGHTIEHRNEWAGRVCRSSYRIVEGVE